MTTTIAVLCPAGPGDALPGWAADFGGVILPPIDPDSAAPWIAQAALSLHAAIESLPPARSVTLVAVGTATTLVPHLGFAARAARRPISRYVLVDGELPAASARASDWPDAAVVVVCPAESQVAAQAALRGWEVLSGNPADMVAEVESR